VAIKMTKWVVGGSLLLGQIIACLDQQRAWNLVFVWRRIDLFKKKFLNFYISTINQFLLIFLKFKYYFIFMIQWSIVNIISLIFFPTWENSFSMTLPFLASDRRTVTFTKNWNFQNIKYIYSNFVKK
jgi:hypothetical protein